MVGALLYRQWRGGEWGWQTLPGVLLGQQYRQQYAVNWVIARCALYRSNPLLS